MSRSRSPYVRRPGSWYTVLASTGPLIATHGMSPNARRQLDERAAVHEVGPGGRDPLGGQGVDDVARHPVDRSPAPRGRSRRHGASPPPRAAARSARSPRAPPTTGRARRGRPTPWRPAATAVAPGHRRDRGRRSTWAARPSRVPKARRRQPAGRAPAVGPDVVAVGVERSPGPPRPAGRGAEPGDQVLHRCPTDVDDRLPGDRRADRRRCRPCPSPARRRHRPPSARPARPRRSAPRTMPASRSPARRGRRPGPRRCRTGGRRRGPSTSITRRATLLLLVDTAIHRPSAHRYVPRGTV